MEKHLNLARRTIVVLVVVTMALLYHGWHQSQQLDKLLSAWNKATPASHAIK